MLTDDIRIGRIEARDLQSVRKLASSRLREEYTLELFHHLFENMSGCFLTAKQEDAVLGFIVGVPLENTTLRVLMIAVKGSRSRQGIGSMLMAAAEGYASLRRMSSVLLEVGTDNKDAIGFYSQLGYRITGIIPEYYHDRSDAFTMRKFISM